MFVKREIKLTLLLLFIFTALSITSISCKKTPTSSDVDVLNLPVIWLSAFELSFAASETGSNPSSEFLMVKNSGHKTLNYTISDDASWLSVKPTSGSSNG